MASPCVLSPPFFTFLGAAAVVTLLAQTAPPNATGISMGHIHLIVPDPAAMQKVWVNVMGGKPDIAGPLTLVKLPKVFIIITAATAPGRVGTNGSVVNHVGFSVKSYAATKAKAEAAGLALCANSPLDSRYIRDLPGRRHRGNPGGHQHPNRGRVQPLTDLSVPDPNAARSVVRPGPSAARKGNAARVSKA